MRTATRLLLAALLVGGCTVQAAPPPGPVVVTPGPAAAPAPVASAPKTFRGEVWTWDEQANTITLRQGSETFRVKVTPDQFVGLQLHQIATIRGELAPPAEIAQITVPAVPMTAVPRGPADQLDLSGTVASVQDTKLTVTTDRGPLQVWVASGAETRFKPGSPVRIRVSVQPVDMVPATAQAPSMPSAMPEGAASVSTAPGDYAVAVGPVLRAESTGIIVVESPQGPLQVAVSDVTRYRAGQPVQLRTSVHPAQ
jgi:hypothetical protein